MEKIVYDPNFLMDVEKENTFAFTLKSGRVIRKVRGAPQIQKRNWKLPIPPEGREDISKTELQGLPLIGEVAHNLHYTSMIS